MEKTSCEICHAPYNTRGKRPVLLSCNRTICLKCQGLLSDSECPFCKEIIALEEIKINIEVLRMVKLIEQKENSKPKDAEFLTKTPGDEYEEEKENLEEEQKKPIEEKGFLSNPFNPNSKRIPITQMND